jgi:iron(III) transport system ATP-binding protein
MEDIRVVGLAKSFGKVRAVDDLSFDVTAGSIVSLLGPSGCGKTTTLRLVAGLENADAGEVYVGTRLLTSAARGVHLPPERRRMGMVFQSYAIWPHMTVFENIAFPLRAQRMATREIRARVMAMLQSLGLEGFHDRPAPLLSGGQQQRVAVARALVANPDVLLLDEPFSNLDARLREEMRLELKEVQARVGVTTLFVTHDQTEAMILSDRVLVMNTGRIAQDGEPQEVYEHPRTRFIMDFLGQVNHVNARVRHGADGAAANVTGGRGGLVYSAESSVVNPDTAWQRGDTIVLTFRPNDVLVGPASLDGAWHGVIQSTVYLGERVEYIVKIGTAQIRAFGVVSERMSKGTPVRLHIPAHAIRVWRR